MSEFYAEPDTATLPVEEEEEDSPRPPPKMKLSDLTNKAKRMGSGPTPIYSLRVAEDTIHNVMDWEPFWGVGYQLRRVNNQMLFQADAAHILFLEYPPLALSVQAHPEICEASLCETAVMVDKKVLRIPSLDGRRVRRHYDTDDLWQWYTGFVTRLLSMTKETLLEEIAKAEDIDKMKDMTDSLSDDSDDDDVDGDPNMMIAAESARVNVLPCL